jgi:hypothetical protein
MQLEMFLRALYTQYPEDLTAPGISVAYIRDRKYEDKFEFYVAVNRFTKAFGQGKINVLTVTRPTLDEAMRAAVIGWLQLVGETDFAELRAEISKGYIGLHPRLVL